MHLYGSTRLGMVTQRSATDSLNIALSGGFGTDKELTFTRTEKIFELSNHLGNVLVTVSDKKIGHSSNGTTIDYYDANVLSATDYAPFGMQLAGRTFRANNNYRYGFNGKENDKEAKGEGNVLDFGARLYDPRTGRWFSGDPKGNEYPGHSPYNYALNTPLSAVDPDGKLIIFIGGLRLWVGNNDQYGQKKTKNSYQGIYSYDATKYWSTEKNAFGRKTDIAGTFKERIGDNNAWYTSGSSSWRSQPDQRIEEGKAKAQMFHAMVEMGTIKLGKDETIKIVCHSQGGAFSEGFAEQLMSYKDAQGEPVYKIEVVYFITPHQPDKFTFNLPSVRGVQYSHPNDMISSDDPWYLPNGGSKFQKILGVQEFDGRDIMGGPGQPPVGTLNGNRGGHNVTDNDFIFDIQPGQPGFVAPRKDPAQPTNTPGTTPAGTQPSTAEKKQGG